MLSGKKLIFTVQLDRDQELYTLIFLFLVIDPNLMGCNKMPNKTLYFPVSHFTLWVYSDQQNKTQIAYAP